MCHHRVRRLFREVTALNYVEQEIVLETETSYGSDIPLAISASLLRRLEETARPCVRMVLEGTSASVGAPPAWLKGLPMCARLASVNIMANRSYM